MKKTVFIKLRVLINSQFFSLTLISFVLLFTTSCKNFLNGGDLISSLEETIRYNNASYVSVEIKADIDVTKELNPAAGKYADKYKAGDSFEISFVPASKYQFIGWKVTPEGSVSLVDTKAATTIVTIESDKNPIVIEPVLCEKPTVSFLPKNAVSVEKNTPIIITFSKPMDITQEDIERIQINTIAGSVLEYFPNPTLSEDKTTITYTADDTKLLSFEGDVQNVTIVVPQDFYYLYDGEKIMMENEVSYTYMVNQQTSSKLSLTVSNPNPNAGTCNLDGENFFSIGAIQNLNIPVLQDYAFSKWIVTDLEGQEILPSIYEQFFVFENIYSESTNITVKKIGSGFCISPVCIKRAHVVASTPAYEKTGVNRATDIRILFDQDMSESSIYWTEEELTVIKREWQAKGASAFDYSTYVATGKKDSNNKLNYYAYAVTTAAGKIKYYKNIEIHKRGSSESLLDSGYYGMPYFDSPSILVIPAVKDVYAECLPAQIDIEFVIKKGFVNIEGIEIAREYSGCYRTNGGYDITGPSLKWDSKTLAGIYGLKGTKVYDDTEWKLIDDTPKTIATPEEEKQTGDYTEDRTLTEGEMYSELLTVDSFLTLKEEYKIQDTKTVVVDGWFEIQDDSGVAEIVLTLTPVSNNLYPNQSTEKLSINKAYLGQTKLVFGSTDPNATEEEKKKLEFDLSELKVEGIYKLGISIFDIVGNSSEVEFYASVNTNVYYGFTYLGSGSVDLPIGVYCVLDNIYNCEYTVTQNSVNNNRYDIIGNKGKYYLYENTTGDDVTLYTQSKLRSVYKSDKAEKVITDGAGIYIERTTNYPPYLIVEDLFGNLKARKL